MKEFFYWVWGEKMKENHEQTIHINQPEEFLQALKIIGTMITSMFGNDCEVAISNLESDQKNVVWINNGHVTERGVGSPLTKDSRERMMNTNKGLYMNYQKSVGKDRKEIKSSTAIFLVNNKKYSFCINYDCSLEKSMAYKLQSFISMLPNQIEEDIIPDANEELIRELTEAELVQISTPATNLSRKKRIEIVKSLERRGVFNRRNSVPIVADVLEVSRYTIYNDLKNQSIE